jgi:ankyrin repeat protein
MLLSQNDAVADLPDQNGVNPVLLAAKSGNEGLVQLLLEMKAC